MKQISQKIRKKVLDFQLIIFPWKIFSFDIIFILKFMKKKEKKILCGIAVVVENEFFQKNWALPVLRC